MQARPSRVLSITIASLLAAACGSGGGSARPVVNTAPPDLLACRARVDDEYRFAEIALRSMRNLGTGRVSERSGPELRARVHPDGVRVVFGRERFVDDESSRELFVATLDSSAAEQRLTQNLVRDDQPVWSADGESILFTSARDGATGLWIAGARGESPQPFLMVPTGWADVEPDWHVGSDRVVWSRRDPNGRHCLWIVNGTGFGQMQLTDGGATIGMGNGDRDPAFSPDGEMVVFVRRASENQASLCLCDVNTGTVTVRLTPDGDVGLPRFTPTMDRLFFGLAEPNAGRQTLRLAELPLTGGEPTLVWPDERWRLRGIDFLPGAPAIEPAEAPERLDIEQADIQIAFASNAFGSNSQLEADDDNAYYLETKFSDGRQIAGINCLFDVPVDDAEDALEFRVRAIVRASNVDGDSLFRMSLYNPTDSRFDTVVELTATSTGEHTMQFRTSSLRHVTREKQFRVTVIADLDVNDPADFWIDLVEVDLVARQTPR